MLLWSLVWINLTLLHLASRSSQSLPTLIMWQPLNETLQSTIWHVSTSGSVKAGGTEWGDGGYRDVWLKSNWSTIQGMWQQKLKLKPKSINLGWVAAEVWLCVGHQIMTVKPLVLLCSACDFIWHMFTFVGFPVKRSDWLPLGPSEDGNLVF